MVDLLQCGASPNLPKGRDVGNFVETSYHG